MKAAIQRVKHRLNRKRKVSQRILAKKLNMSKTTVHRTVIDDLHYRPSKIIQEPVLTDEQRQNRNPFSHWVKNNLNKSYIYISLLSSVHYIYSQEVWFGQVNATIFINHFTSTLYSTLKNKILRYETFTKISSVFAKPL